MSNFKGRSNFTAMMQEYCVGLGYCGSETHVTDLIPKEGIVSVDQFVCLLLQAEGFEPYEFKIRQSWVMPYQPSLSWNYLCFLNHCS